MNASHAFVGSHPGLMDGEIAECPHRVCMKTCARCGRLNHSFRTQCGNAEAV